MCGLMEQCESTASIRVCDNYRESAKCYSCGPRLSLAMCCCLPCLLLAECAGSALDIITAAVARIKAAATGNCGKPMTRKRSAADGAPLVGRDSLIIEGSDIPNSTTTGIKAAAADYAGSVGKQMKRSVADGVPLVDSLDSLSIQAPGSDRAAVAARLCLLQRADGRFPDAAALAAVLGMGEKALASVLEEAAEALVGIDKGLIPTLVAVAAMRGPLAGQRAVWELMETKAAAVLEGGAATGGCNLNRAVVQVGELLGRQMVA